MKTQFVIRSKATNGEQMYLMKYINNGKEVRAEYSLNLAEAMKFESGAETRAFLKNDNKPRGLGRVIKIND